MTDPGPFPKGVRGGDPLGKSALFSPPPETPVSDVRPPEAESAEGSRAVASDANEAAYHHGATGLGVEFECGGCGQNSRLTLVEAMVRLVALAPWIPWTRYNRLVNCPACHHWRWCHVRWTA